MKARHDAWALKHPRAGNLMLFTVECLRRYAIGKLLQNYPTDRRPTWKQMYRKGWRAVRVTVTETP
jgi:hypothetical protein